MGYHIVWKSPKMSNLNLSILAFSTKNSSNWPIFGIFNELLSNQNVNVARFARNVELIRLLCRKACFKPNIRQTMFRLFASLWNMCSPCLLRSSIVIKFQRNVALEMKRFVIRSDILSNVHLRDRNAKQSHRKNHRRTA